MEYQFQNTNTLSQAQVIEHYHSIYKKSTKISIFGTACGLLYVAFILNFDRLWIGLLSFLAAFLFAKYFQQPRKEAERAYSQLLEYYDSKMMPTNVYFGENIIIENADQSRVLEYRKIDKIVSMKYSYAIYDKRPSVLFLDPNGFTKGTFEEFKQFLRGKRPDLNIPE